MRKMLKQVGEWITKLITVILAVLLICNIYILVARTVFHVPHPSVFGYSNAVVLSGSMEPAINVNDMVLIHEEQEYQVGDIVMYEHGDMLVTHRIIDINDDGYILKGDANNTDDGLIPETLLVGKVVFIIPKMGVLIEIAQTPLGMFILMLICYGLFVLPAYLDMQEDESDCK